MISAQAAARPGHHVLLVDDPDHVQERLRRDKMLRTQALHELLLVDALFYTSASSAQTSLAPPPAVRPPAHSSSRTCTRTRCGRTPGLVEATLVVARGGRHSTGPCPPVAHGAEAMSRVIVAVPVVHIGGTTFAPFTHHSVRVR